MNRALITLAVAVIVASGARGQLAPEPKPHHEPGKDFVWFLIWWEDR